MQAERATAPSATLDAAAARARMAALDAPPRLDLLAQLQAAATSGMRPARLVGELGRSMRGPGRLTAHEYFYYRLYDPALPREEARRHVGKRAQQAFHNACNDVRWFAVTHDKALFYAAAIGAGLPVPETVAVYAPGHRGFTGTTLRDHDALVGFLREPAHYPLFAKPIDGMYSIGALSLAGLQGGQVQLVNGEAIELDAVVRFITGFGGEGFLLQRRLDPHPALAQAFGATLPTIRFLVLLGTDGPAIESAVLKIPSPRNPADNYWRTGNMLGALDGEGTVRRAITGVGLALQEVAAHPDTGTKLPGLSVPDWQAATALACHAAAMFPGVRTQSWDVALTDRGPAVLEFNFGGDLNLHQLAHRRGALTPAYAAHLRQCGYRGLRL
jgi:hypothetical protein